MARRFASSIRAIYGTAEPSDQTDFHSRESNIKLMNAVHGSETPRAAQREIRFFFPNCIVEPLPSADDARDFINSKINPTLIRGLTELVKAKPEDPLRYLAKWLESNNPNRPQVEEPED
jgi:nucleoside-diphosphate kinase